MTRVGLLGGTFDPLHIAHLVVADQVLDQLGLDEVRLVVSNESWQKVGERVITPAPQRLEMVRAALSALGTGSSASGRGGGNELVASDVELRIGGSSYTWQTVQTLAAEEPGVDWLVIVGADAAAGLESWHQADDLRRDCEFVVVNRPGSALGAPPGWRTRLVEVPSLALSSTEIRRLVAAGRSIRHLVPDPVMHLVMRWGLYRDGS